MNKELVKKANGLLSEINELNKINELLRNNSDGKNAHFEFVQHYGEVSNHQKVFIDRKYGQRFLDVANQIIKELEIELASI